MVATKDERDRPAGRGGYLSKNRAEPEGTPVRRAVFLRLPVDVADRLQARARAEHRSANNMAEVLLEQALAEPDEDAK